MGLLDNLFSGGNNARRTSQTQRTRSPMIMQSAEDGARIVRYDDNSASAVGAKHNFGQIYGANNMPSTFARRTVIEVPDGNGGYTPVNQGNPGSPIGEQIIALDHWRETGSIFGAGQVVEEGVEGSTGGGANQRKAAGDVDISLASTRPVSSPTEFITGGKKNKSKLSSEDGWARPEVLHPSSFSAGAGDTTVEGGAGSDVLTAPASSWLKMVNEGATRNQPLSDKLQQSMSFLGGMGVTMEVFSGGQDGKGEGDNRTGSIRHDHGDAGDARFYLDGKQLKSSNAADRLILTSIVQQAKANGVTGFGEGADYMGDGVMHVGFGKPGVWGKGGKGANAPDWLRAAYDGVPQGDIASLITEGSHGTAQSSANTPADTEQTYTKPSGTMVTKLGATNSLRLITGGGETQSSTDSSDVQIARRFIIS